MKPIQFALLVGLVGLLLLAGCTGSNNATDSNQNANVNNPGPVTEGNSNTNQPPANTNTGGLDFSQLWSKRTSLNHRIEYKITMSGTNAPQGVAISKYVYYLKQNNVRTDISATTPQGAVESRMYFSYADKSKITNCAMASQTNGWMCYAMTLDKIKAQGGANPDPMDISQSDYTITPDGTKTAAGLTGNCFKMVSKDSSKTDYQARYCITSEGIPIYTQVTTADGAMEMEATSVTNNVTDADFVPPATAQEMPNLGGGSGSSGIDPSVCNQLTGTQKEQCLQALGGS